eukprot:CAMPEP_0117538732 /NCGR_PEP_ID=MMETSP0784-20121206/42629_1 /TAXON_ID=39447 /ORGANISM="" /LENGTH=280 /DNA_ID=CAMNT_0005335353 /DNA_START=85 /DNA_END=927 /DNA_ORIENTATION=-
MHCVGVVIGPAADGQTQSSACLPWRRSRSQPSRSRSSASASGMDVPTPVVEQQCVGRGTVLEGLPKAPPAAVVSTSTAEEVCHHSPDPIAPCPSTLVCAQETDEVCRRTPDTTAACPSTLPHPQQADEAVDAQRSVGSAEGLHGEVHQTSADPCGDRHRANDIWKEAVTCSSRSFSFRSAGSRSGYDDDHASHIDGPSPIVVATPVTATDGTWKTPRASGVFALVSEDAETSDGLPRADFPFRFRKQEVSTKSYAKCSWLSFRDCCQSNLEEEEVRLFTP